MTNTDIITTDNNEIASTDSATATGAICTVDLNDKTGKRVALNAVNNADSLNNHVGEELHICDCITEQGVRRGRNGMPDTPCINTYLIDVDGRAYFSQSDGVSRSVYTIASLWPDFGKVSEDDGYLCIKCVEKVLQNGNTVKNLVVM